MSRPAQTEVPIHEFLKERWSLYAFDPARGVSVEDLHALFEAARWMMSSYNAQPTLALCRREFRVQGSSTHEALRPH